LELFTFDILVGIGRELGLWGFMNYVEPKQVLAWVDPNAKGWGWFQKSKL